MTTPIRAALPAIAVALGCGVASPTPRDDGAPRSPAVDAPRAPAVDVGAPTRRDAPADVADPVAPAPSAPTGDVGGSVVDLPLESEAPCGGLALADDPTDRAATPYPASRVHSPLTAFTARHLRAIASVDPTRRRDVFMKVGDSMTVASTFLGCLDDGVALGPAACAAGAIAGFDGSIEGATCFDRASLAAQVGAGAGWAVDGAPSPMEQELAASDAAFAVVMYGTNDALGGGTFDAQAFDFKFRNYAKGLFAVVDGLTARGVVPIVSSVPPRTDDPLAPHTITTMNAIARGVAQGRQVPFVDVHRELTPLPGQGVGEDGVHVSVYGDGSGHDACVFDDLGLSYGQNVRNLVVVQALERARRVVVDGDGALEPAGAFAKTAGTGTKADPVVVAEWPFTDLRALRGDLSSTIADTSSCGGAGGLTSSEVFYRVDVSARTRVRAVAVTPAGADVRVAAYGPGGGCAAAGGAWVGLALDPGTWTFVVDAAGNSGHREFLFVLHACADGDPACG